jgi:hypothetical protein
VRRYDLEWGVGLRWCDGYCRWHDEREREIMRYSCCAYCGRTELRLGKLWHKTPIPKASQLPDDYVPF